MKDLERRIRRLGDQLDAIALAVEGIEREDRAEQRERWLHAVKFAVSQARQEQQALAQEEHRRPHLRVIPGGIASLGAGLAALPRIARNHAVTTAATAGLLAATSATLYVTEQPNSGTPSTQPSPARSVGAVAQTPARLAPSPHASTRPSSRPARLPTKPTSKPRTRASITVSPSPSLPAWFPSPSLSPSASPGGDTSGGVYSPRPTHGEPITTGPTSSTTPPASDRGTPSPPPPSKQSPSVCLDALLLSGPCLTLR